MNSTKQFDVFDVIASGVKLAVIVMILSAFSSFAHGQVSGGSVSGTIKDVTLAVVPNASVSIENVDTGVKHEQSSNRDGEYVVPNLQPGNYTISCTAAGFSKAVLKGIAVGVGSELVIDLTMALGPVTDTISVESATPVVELSDTSVSQIVSGNTVRELPLNGRDWTLLATLQPGVAQIEAQPAVGVGNDRGNRGLGVQLAVGGNRPQANNYRLDGISISDYSNGAPGDPLGITLGVDAIKEFSVITNDAPASYGRTSGESSMRRRGLERAGFTAVPMSLFVTALWMLETISTGQPFQVSTEINSAELQAGRSSKVRLSSSATMKAYARISVLLRLVQCFRRMHETGFSLGELSQLIQRQRSIWRSTPRPMGRSTEIRAYLVQRFSRSHQKTFLRREWIRRSRRQIAFLVRTYLIGPNSLNRIATSW